jgi:hypothetical protein
MAFLVVAPHKENSDGDYSMTEFKAVSGGWTKPSEGNYKGVVDASLSARCIAGSETDENIEFYTTVKITTGKAALICNYKLDEDWNEHYVEMVLDPTGDKVTLEAVTRDDTGIETFRATLASRNMALAAATEYNCRIASKQLPDGSYAVYGYVDDFLLVEAEDLDANFQKGMHGLESLGADTNYSEYSYPAFGLTTWYCTLANVKDELKITDSASDAELLDYIRSSYKWVNDFLESQSITNPVSSPYPDSVVDACKYYACALAKEREKSVDATSYYKRAEDALQVHVDAEGKIPFMGQA